jgi:LmbE family N-acetylglucosaminyl deacetylase
MWMGLAILSSSQAFAADPNPAAVLQELKSFDQMGSVLLIAAHPDDEDTQLLTYLAHGRNYRAAYLSVTRGDGGQNVLGDQFGPELGVIRTHELLAARQLDGARQFFTRAIDFGFSKDYRQTLTVWDEQGVLSDIVRVIREFRPDVMVTRFSTIPGNTHGHHTASAVLGLQAFKLAGDPTAFPDQLKDLTIWQPKRIFTTGFGIGMARGGGGGAATQSDSLVRVDVSGTDPVSGLSFGDLSGLSRSMHKTQGFGTFTPGRGGGGRGGQRSETLQLQGGDPATNDLMDGVDTSWNRVDGGTEIGKLADDLIANFNSTDLSANVTGLLAIKALVAKLPADRIIDEKRGALDHVIQECLGLEVATTIPQAEVVPGEGMNLHHSVTLHASIPVRWMGVRYPSIGGNLGDISDTLITNQSAAHDATETLPASTPISQPYWLREQGTRGMFRVDDVSLIGRPLNPPVFPVEYLFEVGGQTLVVPDEPVAADGPANRPRTIDVIPPVSLKFVSDVQLFAPGSKHSLAIDVIPNRPNVACTLRLSAPDGWAISPAQQAFTIANLTDRAHLSFDVTAPSKPEVANITADVQVGDAHFDNQRIEIDYPHIPFILLQPKAVAKAVALDLSIRGKTVGYITGAGDSVDAALAQMGYSVVELKNGEITAEKLSGLDAVVVGVRAFAVRKDLAAAMPALTDFVRSGGNMIIQYQRAELGLSTLTLGSHSLQLTNNNTYRVTDPNAVMTFLAPDHPALNVPNKITADDFTGWVQERGTYFPSQWDDQVTAIFACNDVGEAPLKGSLLVAQEGKGYFVYTGLGFFRQLPAGNPGAYRLFANLVSLGK